MKAIGSRFRRHDYLASGVSAILRWEDSGENLELLDRIHGGPKGGGTQQLIIVIQTVQREIIVQFTCAGYVEAAAETQDGTLRSRSHTGHQKRQAVELPAVQR